MSKANKSNLGNSPSAAVASNVIYDDAVPRQESEVIVEPTVMEVLMGFIDRIRTTSPIRLLFVCVLIVLLMAGNALQIIGLNFWLRKFPEGGVPGNFTTLAVSALLFGVFFVLALIVYVIAYRPNLRFALEWRGLALLTAIGLMDTVNSGLAIYAASYTPEVLQALFTALIPVYAAVCTKVVLKDNRNYFTWLVAISFFFIIGGIVVASASHFVNDETEDEGNKKWWSVIFFISVPPTVLMNVWQTKYMLAYTEDEITSEHLRIQATKDEYTRVGTDDNVNVAASPSDNSLRTVGTNSSNSNSSAGKRSSEDKSHAPLLTGRERSYTDQQPHHVHNVVVPQGDDMAVKLVMLSAGTTLQFAFIMMMLPMDALPWWGGSDSVPEAWTNFMAGLDCLVHCPQNFLYCMVYSVGFIFTYIGSAYLNQYSVTLCSMIGQLSSPITALVLIIFPSLNLAHDNIPLSLSILSVAFLSVGTFTYTIWEQKTEEEKDASERHYREFIVARRRREILRKRNITEEAEGGEQSNGVSNALCYSSTSQNNVNA